MSRTTENKYNNSFFITRSYLLVIWLLLCPFISKASVFSVTNSNDSGAGSLRSAIIAANTLSGFDQIQFNIPGAGPHTIQLLTALPAITDQVTIDGYTQSGSAVATSGSPADIRIEIDGTAVTSLSSGLVINGATASNSIIKGLAINGFYNSTTTSGIMVYWGDNIQIEGNWIGLDIDGLTAIPNSRGILVNNFGTNAVIGGPAVAQRNVISGNTYRGIEVLSGFFSIQNNFIGTNAGGTSALPNNGNGILMDQVQGEVLDNVVSGNASTGIHMDGPYTYAPGTFLTIRGNKIGTDNAGTGAIANGSYGILIQADCYNVEIGGVAVGQANTIANNAGEGIVVKGNNVNISANAIYNNGGLGIDLGTTVPDGVTSNDNLDADSGPNNLQNYPIFYSDTTDTNIKGFLNSTASTSFRIDYFSNNSGTDPSGHGEGELYLTSQILSTNASGILALTYTAASGNNFSATATNLSTDETSEFSYFIAPPTAEDDIAGTSEGIPVNITVQDNDYAGNGGVLQTSSIYSNPTNGSAVIQGDETITYTPGGSFTGLDNFQYVLCENTLGFDVCDTATVSVNVYPMVYICNGNASDTLYVDAASASYSFGWTLPTGAIITETIGDTMIVVDWTGAALGLDQICVFGTNACGSSDPLCKSITIENCNQAPTAANDFDTTAVNNPIIIDVLANDTDPDDTIDPTSVYTVGVLQASNGTVAINPTTGEITYDPDPCFYGSDSLEYIVCDNGIPTLCDTAMLWITVLDTIPPVLAAVPLSTTVECNAVPAAGNPTATDNCDPTVTISLNETNTQTSDGSCTDDNYTITRTWTATDDSGNTDTGVQIITVQDTSPALLSGIPNDTTVICSGIPTAASPIVSDNCDPSVGLTLSESDTQTSDGSCADNSYTLTRTWVATDNCGNTDEQTQIITVIDTIGPVLSGVPADITVATVPLPANPTATDNCDAAVDIAFVETSIPNGCSYTVTRTWTATDNCGNTDIQTQVITVNVSLSASGVVSSNYNGEDISCVGSSDGSIDITVGGGTGPYTYSWNEDLLSLDAYWTFENTTNDVSGNNNNAISIYGNLNYSSDAVSGNNSFYFDDQTRIRYDVNGGFLDTAITYRTIMMWIKPSTLSGNQTLFEEGDDNNGFAIRLDDNELEGAAAKSGGNDPTDKITFPNDGQWHHVALVYDNGDLTLYLDGVAGLTENTGYSGITLTGDQGGLGGKLSKEAFGGGPGSNRYNGLMDEVLYYSRALSPTEISNANNGTGLEDRSGLSAGTYTVTVTDTYGCTAETSVTVTDPTPLSLSFTQVNADCIGTPNGSIDLTVSGGVNPPPYTYVWSNGPSTEDISSLAVGTYIVTVTDANGCVAIDSVTISNSGTLNVTAVTVNLTCNGDNDGSIDITVTGGLPGPKTFAWSNLAISEDITGLTPGPYTVTVTDGGGCTKVESYTITEPAILVAAAGTNDFACPGESIAIGGTPTATGGTGPYTYAWSNGAGTDANPTVFPVTTTTYSLIITDNNGCTATDQVLIDLYTPPVITMSIEQAISCAGYTDGEAKAAAGDPSGFTFEWSNGQSGEDLLNVGDGTYIVTVTEIATGCSNTASIVLTEPAGMSLAFSITTDYNGYAVSCDNASDGAVDITVTGGTGPYDYNWYTEGTSNFEARWAFNDDTDDDSPNAHNATSIVGTENYDGDRVEGGKSFNFDGSTKIQYSVSSGFMETAFSYRSISMWIKPATLSGEQVLYEEGTTNNGIAIRLLNNTLQGVVQSSGNKKLAGSHTFPNDGNWHMLTLIYNNGALTLYLDGVAGTTNNTGFTTIPANNSLGGLGGTFNSDAFDNWYTSTFYTGFMDDVLFYNLALTSGQVADLYNSGVSSGIADPTLEDISSLSKGWYSVTVTDDNNCTTVDSVFLDAPPILSANAIVTSDFSGEHISCPGQSDAIISANVSGGVGGYTYLWDGGQTTVSVNSLPAGLYQVTVTDGNGCTSVSSVNVQDPPALTVSANVTSDYNGGDVSCNGASDGIAGTIVSGGAGAYTYAWSNGPTTANNLNIGAGTYDVTVTDGNGCTASTAVTLTDPAALASTATVTSNYSGYHLSCANGSDGSATASGSGGTVSGSYSYLWSDGQTAANLLNAMAGTYYVSISDDNACTVVDSVTLIEPPGMTVTASITTNYNGYDLTCPGASDANAIASTSGGGGGYSYVWSNGQTGANLTNVAAGSYIVTVTDANACTATDLVLVSDPPGMNATITKVTYNGADVNCGGDADGGMTVSVTEGVAPYFYAWSTGGTGNTISNLGAGTYTVTITDAFGCTIEDSETIVEPTPLTVSANITSDYNGYDISCLGGSDGAALASASGGAGGCTYLWNTGQTIDSLTNASAGIYFVTVTDANGCTATTSVTLTDPPDIDVNISQSNLTDCDVMDGIILVNASGGIGGFEYRLDAGAWQSQNFFINLGVGIYNIYVRNGSGTCETGPFTVTLDYPEAPLITNVTIINPSTTSSNDGAALVYATSSTILLEYRIAGLTPWQTSNLFSDLDEGTFDVEVRYYGSSCVSTQTINLVAGGGIVGGGGGTTFCSGDVNGSRIVETYYIPFPEDQVYSHLSALYYSSCGSGDTPQDSINSYISIGVVEANTQITFDHHEDGYESNISFPVQSTTEVWGDGNLVNGAPPGYAVDILNAGDNIVLQNKVYHPTINTVIDFDGGDKIASQGNLVMTRLAWADGPGTLMAGALEVFPDLVWGTSYQVPIGEDADVNNMFEYVGAVIMANTDTTTVLIDLDGNGSTDITTTLHEGDSYLVNGNMDAGATVNADKPVQVHLLSGDVCAQYETRWFTLTPTSNWSDSYYNPVATQTGGGDSDPTFVHLYNPNSSPITVNWETNAGSQTNINIVAGSTAWVRIPDGTGSHFYTTTGDVFYAVATIDSEDADQTHDWGFAILPENLISQQITMVAFAPGHTPGVSSSDNTSPIFLTADYPTGSPSTGSITVCIDYDGDGGAFTDANGVQYDVTQLFNPLDMAKIYDPDGDQTGIRMWVCDGSDAIIAGAWGQDPSASGGSGQPDEMDMGTGIPNGIPYSSSKCVDLSNDQNGNGLFDECDEVNYSIMIRNTGVLPISTGALTIIDTIPTQLTYIDNTTSVFAGSGYTAIADDLSPASPFPFDESGLNYNGILLPGDSILIRFEATINSLIAAQFVQNMAYIVNNNQVVNSEVTFLAEAPLPPTSPSVPPADTTLACNEAIPDPPLIDTTNVVYTEVQTNGACSQSYTLTRTWEVTDYCARVATYTQIITVQDIVAPTLFNVPADTIVAFDSIPLPPTITAYDTCDVSLSVVYTENTIPNVCGFTLERTWSATDDCGNIMAATQNITVNSSISISASVTSNYNGRDISCFGLSDGSASATAVGGGGALTYTWSNAQTGPNLINVPAGTYSVTVSDTGGCTATTSVTLFDPPDMNINANISSNYNGEDISCPGASDGSAIAFASGGNGTLTYLWSTTATTNSITGLSAGTYTVTATDQNACTISASLTLNDPTPLSVSAAITTNYNGSAISCAGANDGGALATAIGGTATISYAWSNGQTGNTLSTVTAGTYNITATDANGCTATSSVLISDPPPLNISTNITTSINCAGDTNGDAQATAGGGTGALSYVWSNGQSGVNLVNVGAGTYTVTATDANGCSITDNVIFTDPPALSIAASVTSDYNGENVSCVGSTDGIALAVGSGGSGILTYAWSNTQTGTILLNVGAGTYQVTVTDANSCTAETSVTLTNPPPLTVSVSLTTPVSCTGGSDGEALAAGSGGVGGYTYNWSNLQAGATLLGVNAGTYDVTLTDANGCTATNSVSFIDPPVLSCTAAESVAISTFGGNDGEASVTPAGGTAGYTYLWSNGQNTATAIGLSQGTHTVTVTDSRGCTSTCSATLDNPSRIGDFVWTDANMDGVQDFTESGLANVSVQLTGTDENLNPVSRSMITDASGAYAFDGVLPGTYTTTFTAPAGYLFVNPDQGGDDFLDSDANTGTGEAPPFVILTPENITHIDAGFTLVAGSRLGDFVWEDSNEDGIQDGGEPGIQGVTVSLYNIANVLISTTTTDVAGGYSFNGLVAGDYYIVFDVSTNTAGITAYKGTPQYVGSTGTDSNAHQITGQTDVFTFNPASGDELTIDAGFILACPPEQRAGVTVAPK